MLVESSDDAIIGMTPQSVITTWNRAAQRLYGYTSEEVVGKNIEFLLPPDRLEELDAVLGRVAKGAGAQRYETKRITKDGTIIDVGMTVSPIHDLEDGDVIVGTSTIQRDISERKKTDAILAEMAAIVDSSNDAIIGKTLQGIITTWNRGAEHVYGYTAAEMVGRSISVLVPKERPDEVREIIAGMLANGRPHEALRDPAHMQGRPPNRRLAYRVADPRLRRHHRWGLVGGARRHRAQRDGRGAQGF